LTYIIANIRLEIQAPISSCEKNFNKNIDKNYHVLKTLTLINFLLNVKQRYNTSNFSLTSKVIYYVCFFNDFSEEIFLIFFLKSKNFMLRNSKSCQLHNR